MNLMNIFLYAQQAGAQSTQGSMWSTLIMILLLILIFWLFYIRPQSKKNKEMQKFRDSLKKGDRIVTIGGIHGKIVDFDGNTVIIETEGQGKIRVEKSAIQQYEAGSKES
ncbi:MAG: preprotein translocase subunit YajC [Bacteroidales bacterium]|jgi:preprotein translocase subunit YajC